MVFTHLILDRQLKYLVKAKNENGIWKITYLERFDVKNYTWN